MTWEGAGVARGVEMMGVTAGVARVSAGMTGVSAGVAWVGAGMTAGGFMVWGAIHTGELGVIDANRSDGTGLRVC